MGKTLLTVMIGAVIFMIFGTELTPDSPAFWLAGSAMNLQAVRFGMLLIMMLQFATEPPRNKLFRVVSALAAVSLASWSLWATYFNHMLFLDTLCFVGVAIAVGLIALERKPMIASLGTTKLQPQTA